MDFKSLNIDKSKWNLTPLGDLVTEISKRVDNPSQSEFDKFVGLEHFVSGDLKIRQWGSTANLTSSTKAFKSGDILFARRNAYLRRASLVTFDGVCSGDAFVLRENLEMVVPGFLAFVMNSNALWDYANANAAGTMSKRVKWRDLANYEFLLPPIEQQIEIADLLWAMANAEKTDVTLLRKIQKFKSSFFLNSLLEGCENSDVYFGRKKSKFPVQPLGDLIFQMQYGISESLSLDAGVPVLRMNNLQNGELELSDLKYFDFSKDDLEKYRLDRGDVLFNRTNSFDLVGKVSLFDKVGVYSFASYLIRIKTDAEKLDSRFLNFYLNLPIGMSKIRKYRTPGVSQSNINAKNLKRVPVPTPDVGLQRELMDKVDEISQSETSLKDKIKASRALQKTLINKVF